MTREMLGLNRTQPLPACFLTGRSLLQDGRPLQALPLLQAAYEADPGHVAALHAYASCLEKLARFSDMHHAYARAAALLPGDASVLAGLGRSWLQSGDRNQARTWLQRAWQLAPERPVAAGQYGKLLREEGQAEAACAVLQPAVAAHPGLSELCWEYAQSLLACDRLDEAFACFTTFRQLRPTDPAAAVALGRIGAARGKIDQAQGCFRAALAIDPGYAPALWELAHVCRNCLDRAELDAVETGLTRPIPKLHRALLEDVLARDCDRRADYVAAALHAQRANAHHAAFRAASSLSYDPQAHAREIDATMATFDADLLRRLAQAGVDSERPVFVFGLPRSGTTLIEQMLGAHPQAVGIGEQTLARQALQAAIDDLHDPSQPLSPAAVRSAAQGHLQAIEERRQRLAPTRAGLRVIDKMPDNYLLAGWLAIAFPKAALIHCRRDPRDVALSCWLAQFTQLGWSFDLDHIVHRIEQHQRLMQHWRAMLGSRLVEVDYENMVEQPELQARHLVAAMGLPWDPQVMDSSSRSGVVRSASQMQVREPINRRGIARWRNYRLALAPVQARLEGLVRNHAG